MVLMIPTQPQGVFNSLVSRDTKVSQAPLGLRMVQRPLPPQVLPVRPVWPTQDRTALQLLQWMQTLLRLPLHPPRVTRLMAML